MELNEDAGALLGLQRLKKNKRQAIYGFPMELGEQYSMRLVEKGISVSDNQGDGQVHRQNQGEIAGKENNFKEV